MIWALLWAVPLSVQGHHALPLHPEPEACRVSHDYLRQRLDKGLRPERLRALAMLTRCGFAVDRSMLKRDGDPEMRLAAWVLDLRQRMWRDSAFEQALRALPPRFNRTILRLRERKRRAWTQGKR
jgi:hypothetical protein